MSLLLGLAIGAAAGFVGGLLGVGGGIIVVPALALLAGFDMRDAVGTSSAAIVFTAVSAAYKHHRNGHVVWPTVAMIVVGSVVCAYLGAALAHRVPQIILKRVFAAFLVMVAIQMLASSYQRRLDAGRPAAISEERSR